MDILSLLLKHWRLLLVTPLFIGFTWLGYYLRGDASDVLENGDCTGATESGVQHVHNQTTTTTTNADANGKVLSTTTTVSTADSNSKSEHVSATPKPAPSATKSKYQIDASTNPYSIRDAKIGIGARLGDLPAFGILEYEVKDKTVRAGVRLEW